MASADHAPPAAPEPDTYPPSPPSAEARHDVLAEEKERHWGHFGAGLGLSFCFSLFALFALFFIKKSDQKKFFLYGCAVGIGINIFLILVLWFLGFFFISFAFRNNN